MILSVTKWKEKPDTEYSEDGLIRLNTAKPEYGSIMLAAIVVGIQNGFINSRKRIGFVSGNVKELEDILLKHEIVENSDFSTLVSPHRIVVLEKLESEIGDEFGYIEKVNPSTGEILTKDSEVIFRKTEVVEEGSDIVDILISHDKIEVSDEASSEFEKSKKTNVLAQL